MVAVELGEGWGICGLELENEEGKGGNRGENFWKKTSPEREVLNFFKGMG